MFAHLEKQVVFLTGAAGAIGQVLARTLLGKGAIVAAVDRFAEGRKHLSQVTNPPEDRLFFYSADVTSQEEISTVVRDVLKTQGRIDLLINNAGILKGIGGLWEVDLKAWWRDLEVSLLGSAICSQAVLPSMMKANSGILINMVGGGFRSPNPGASGYGCAKAALARLTDTLAAEIGDRWNIQVHALAPGLVRSHLTEWMIEEERVEPWFGYVKEGLEKGEANSAEDVAEGLLNLLDVSCPELSGRVFIYNDDFEQIRRSVKRIQEQDLRQTRFQTE